MGHSGRSIILPGTNQYAEKYNREPLARKVRATFMPCFPWTGVGRLPAGQLMEADQWSLMLVCALLSMPLILVLLYAFGRFVHHG